MVHRLSCSYQSDSQQSMVLDELRVMIPLVPNVEQAMARHPYLDEVCWSTTTLVQAKVVLDVAE